MVIQVMVEIEPPQVIDSHRSEDGGYSDDLRFLPIHHMFQTT